MTVMRTAESVLGRWLPETNDHDAPGTRAMADRLMACLGSPLFVVARMTGWSAHGIGQRIDNTIIRPAVRYVGPGNRKFVSIHRRKP